MRWRPRWIALLSLQMGLARSAVEEVWWQPGPGVSWDWQLPGLTIATEGIDMYDFDLFDVPARDMRDLKSKGIVVICYFSAGTYEEYRDDEDQFPRSSLGKPLEDADLEWWININDPGVKAVMESRLDLAVEKGCDGVEPDALEVFSYEEAVSGWEISAEDQLTYNKWIADQAHARNLSVALKNDATQVAELEPWFDWALSTDCYVDEHCTFYEPFTSAGKAVLNAEFSVSNRDFCAENNANSIDGIVKDYALDDRRCSCGFPATDVDCESLLAANNPTVPPSEVDSDVADMASTADGAEETKVWAIIVTIALVVLVVMAIYAAVVWKRKRRDASDSKGVDDFCEGFD